MIQIGPSAVFHDAMKKEEFDEENLVFILLELIIAMYF